MKNSVNPNSDSTLRDLALESLNRVSARCLVKKAGRAGEAYLFWGKAASASFHAAGFASDRNLPPVLVISPESSPGARFRGIWFQGEHPLPGPGSYEAAKALLDFFDLLHRTAVPRLHVFLSGGASSLAWLPPLGLSAKAIHQELVRLYRRPLSIAELNHRRSRLCLLKAGGAARILQMIAPRVRVEVKVISDVAPFPVSVVGSGPFHDGKVPHHLLADNGTWVDEISRLARDREISVVSRSAGRQGDWQTWVHRIETAIARAPRDHAGFRKPGLIIEAGEPSVDLRHVSRSARGGRQTQIAASLLLLPGILSEVAQDRLEILCLASDGSDGNSGGMGALLDRAVALRLQKRLGRGDRSFQRELKAMNSATALQTLGAILPARSTGTNVQDAVIVRILT